MFQLIIKSIKINKKLIFAIVAIFLVVGLISSFVLISLSTQIHSIFFWNQSNTIGLNENEDYIKWVDFRITADALSKTAKLDIDSHNSDSEIKYNWIELLAYLACKNGGYFKKFNQNDLNKLIIGKNKLPTLVLTGGYVSQLEKLLTDFNEYYYGIVKDIYPKNKLLWLVDRKVDHNEIAWRYHFPYSFDFHK